MTLATAVRAVALIAAALVGTSLAQRWGAATGIGAGPPMQWERQVVGALLLAGVVVAGAAFGGRGGRRPALATRLVVLGAGLGALLLALLLRRDAALGFTDLVAGAGWRCMAIGAALATAAALGFQAVGRGPAGASSGHRRRAPRRSGGRTR